MFSKANYVNSCEICDLCKKNVLENLPFECSNLATYLITGILCNINCCRNQRKVSTSMFLAVCIKSIKKFQYTFERIMAKNAYEYSDIVSRLESDIVFFILESYFRLGKNWLILFELSSGHFDTNVPLCTKLRPGAICQNRGIYTK
jgi:hypothetical protein